MSKELKILLALAVLVVVGALVATRLYNANETQIQISTTQSAGDNASDDSFTEKLIRPDSPTLGPSMARVHVVEFLDPECESCKEFFPTVKQVLKEYEGGIYFVVRYMGFHRSSAMAMAATESAGLQGKYWEMQELLFNTAEEWGHKEVPSESYFVKYAKELGLDVARFKADLDDPKWRAKLERDMKDGNDIGVRGTPTIFVNGRRLEDLSYDALKGAIDAASAR